MGGRVGQPAWLSGVDVPRKQSNAKPAAGGVVLPVEISSSHTSDSTCSVPANFVVVILQEHSWIREIFKATQRVYMNLLHYHLFIFVVVMGMIEIIKVFNSYKNYKLRIDYVGSATRRCASYGCSNHLSGVLGAVESTYSRWLAASPLEKLSIEPQGCIRTFNQGALQNDKKYSNSCRYFERGLAGWSAAVMAYQRHLQAEIEAMLTAKTGTVRWEGRNPRGHAMGLTRETIPGTAWTLETLIQAAQQIIRQLQLWWIAERPTAFGQPRPEEWDKSSEVMVQLAGNYKLVMRISDVGTLLMPYRDVQSNQQHLPGPQAQTIVPMGQLIETLGYTMMWSPKECYLQSPEGVRIPLQVDGGCPQLAEMEALALIARLEDRKVEELNNSVLTTQDKLKVSAVAMEHTWEYDLFDYVAKGAFESGLRAVRDAPFFADLPGECLSGMIPTAGLWSGWDTMKNLGYLNRAQKRKLLTSKRWIVHLFAGKEGHYEMFKLDQGDTAVIELDIERCQGHDLFRAETWRMLLWGAKEGKIDAIFGGEGEAVPEAPDNEAVWAPGLDATSKGTLGKNLKYLLVGKYLVPKQYIEDYSGQPTPSVAEVRELDLLPPLTDEQKKDMEELFGESESGTELPLECPQVEVVGDEATHFQYGPEDDEMGSYEPSEAADEEVGSEEELEASRDTVMKDGRLDFPCDYGLQRRLRQQRNNERECWDGKLTWQPHLELKYIFGKRHSTRLDRYEESMDLKVGGWKEDTWDLARSFIMDIWCTYQQMAMTRRRIDRKISPDKVQMRATTASPEDAGTIATTGAEEVLREWSSEKAIELIKDLARLGFFEKKKFGVYRHGGTVGWLTGLVEYPQVAKVLTKLVVEIQPDATFTLVMVSHNGVRGMHKDFNNDYKTQNYVIPINHPEAGGELWVELTAGDIVKGVIDRREVNGTSVYSQLLPLRQDQCISFGPKRRHEVNAWEGDRTVLIACTPNCLGKLSQDDLHALHDYGFPVPLSQLPEFSGNLSIEGPELDIKEMKLESLTEEEDDVEWSMYLDLEPGLVKILDATASHEGCPRMLKTEVSYTARIEEVLRGLKGPLDVVHTVNPEEVYANLQEWRPAIEKEMAGVELATQRLLPGTEERRTWLNKPRVQRLPMKFVFTVKPNDQAVLSDPRSWYKRKARLVICGNMASNEGGQVYTETAPAGAVRTGYWKRLAWLSVWSCGDSYVHYMDYERILVQEIGALIKKVWETSELSFLGEGDPIRCYNMDTSQSYYVFMKWSCAEGTRYQSPKSYKFCQRMWEIVVRRAQQITGEVLWVSQRTRPDLAFTTSIMTALCVRCPSRVIQIGDTVLGYLQRTSTYGLTVSWSGTGLTMFCDEAFAPQGERSHGGWVVVYGGVQIVWRSGRQQMVTLSTAESELISIVDGAIALKGVEAILADVGEFVEVREIASDSTAALSITAGVRQPADLLTKALSQARTAALLQLWNIEEVDWDTAGLLMILLMVLGVLLIYESVKWFLAELCNEWSVIYSNAKEKAANTAHTYTGCYEFQVRAKIY
ncbi:RXLR161 [Symbiodinium sp. CCMP2456]|nr:RXLR161 [Symbiodinium sp. CCMP2456]